MRGLVASLVLLLAAGCGGRAADREGDGVDAGCGCVDGTALEAGPGWDAGTCEQESYWVLAPRAIGGVTPLDGVPPRLGAADRLLVEVQLTSACERLARVDVSVEPDGTAETVRLSAYAWTLTTPCAPLAASVTRVVAIPGREQTATHVAVVDGAEAGGAALLTYDRDPCSGVPDCQCGPGAPAGSAVEGDGCLTDCSCGDGLACIGRGGSGSRCLRPCADFRDCEQREGCPAVVADGPTYVCASTAAQCSTDDDCPDGYGCLSSAGLCGDNRMAPATSAPCTCDAECYPGQHCMVALQEQPTCEIPCGRDADCPRLPDVICAPSGACITAD